jgi:hypothetical protein
MFGQCTECQSIQKQLSDVVVQKKGGLTARVIQCNKCFAGNHKMRVFKQEQFATTTKLTPIGGMETFCFLKFPKIYSHFRARFLSGER